LWEERDLAGYATRSEFDPSPEMALFPFVPVRPMSTALRNVFRSGSSLRDHRNLNAVEKGGQFRLGLLMAASSIAARTSVGSPSERHSDLA